MLDRDIRATLQAAASKIPAVAILGPRQSGKTTEAKQCFPNHAYVNLEDLAQREYAQTDPKGFLAYYQEGVIIDEAQHAPDLFSYLQLSIDEHNKPGQYILTGSQNFLLLEKITQSLAGRIALFTLLPFSLHELNQIKHPFSVNELIFQGSYPRIYNQALEPYQWYPSYFQTYVQRDVRSIQNIGNVDSFIRFVKLCAGRIGQILNLSQLGNECGISHNTAKSWLSVLQASYIVYTLQPHHKNYNKRLTKSPKLYFYDTGLACSLLNLEKSEQLDVHFMRGELFENFIINEIMKSRLNQNLQPNLYYWRDQAGYEIDCILDLANGPHAIEIKSGQTPSGSYFKNLKYWQRLANATDKQLQVIYGAEDSTILHGIQVNSWTKLKDEP